MSAYTKRKQVYGRSGASDTSIAVGVPRVQFSKIFMGGLLSIAVLLGMFMSQAKASAHGEELYKTNCAACHQVNGKGLPGAFPPLAGSDLIAKDPSKLMEATLLGLSGPITVNGVEYNNTMPAMSYLSDEDLSAIVTYVLKSWGNPGGSISAAEIGDYRAKGGLEARQGGGERHPGTPESEHIYQ